MNIREIIQTEFKQALVEAGGVAQTPISNETVLLDSGIDSLGFAILVASLEESLGYDPFVIMKEPVYPTTFGEFVSIYENNCPQA